MKKPDFCKQKASQTKTRILAHLDDQINQKMKERFNATIRIKLKQLVNPDF